MGLKDSETVDYTPGIEHREMTESDLGPGLETTVRGRTDCIGV
jgi:hypothetical protein